MKVLEVFHLTNGLRCDVMMLLVRQDNSVDGAVWLHVLLIGKC